MSDAHPPGELRAPTAVSSGRSVQRSVSRQERPPLPLCACNELDSAGGVEALIEPPEVPLDSLRRDAEVERHLIIRAASSKPFEHSELTLVEASKGISALDVARAERGPTDRCPPDGLEDLGDRCRLQDVPGSTEAERRRRVLRRIERGDDDPGRMIPARGCGQELEARAIRQADVDQRKVDVLGLQEASRCLPGAGFARQFDVVFPPQCVPDALDDGPDDGPRAGLGASSSGVPLDPHEGAVGTDDRYFERRIDKGGPLVHGCQSQVACALCLAHGRG